MLDLVSLVGTFTSILNNEQLALGAGFSMSS